MLGAIENFAYSQGKKRCNVYTVKKKQSFSLTLGCAAQLHYQIKEVALFYGVYLRLRGSGGSGGVSGKTAGTHLRLGLGAKAMRLASFSIPPSSGIMQSKEDYELNYTFNASKRWQHLPPGTHLVDKPAGKFTCKMIAERICGASRDGKAGRAP